MKFYLKGKDLEGKLRLTEGEHTIGRIEGAPQEHGVYLTRNGRSELIYLDTTVSRDHLKINIEGNVASLTDNASRYGTFVDEIPIKNLDIKFEGKYDLRLGENFNLVLVCKKSLFQKLFGR